MKDEEKKRRSAAHKTMTTERFCQDTDWISRIRLYASRQRSHYPHAAMSADLLE